MYFRVRESFPVHALHQPRSEATAVTQGIFEKKMSRYIKKGGGGGWVWMGVEEGG